MPINVGTLFFSVFLQLDSSALMNLLITITYRTSLLASILLLTFFACQEDKKAEPKDPTLLLNKVIEAHGDSQVFYNSIISFSIDGLAYQLDRSAHISNFKVSRQKDSVLNEATYQNGLITTYKNGIEQEPAQGLNKLYLNQSFENVAYLLSFPFSLTQNHVILNQLTDVTIRNKPYHVLEVTFTKLEGQPENIFLLYINTQSYQISFMAENFEHSGQQNIFSRYLNYRQVKGLLFYDMYRFKSTQDSLVLNDMYKAYNNSLLAEPTLRKLENISVQIKDTVSN